MAVIDRSSPVPIYFQIARYLRTMIERGELSPGDQLPPEASLAESLRVSRMTLRQALIRLTEEGLLVRQRGRGTFVTERAGELATPASLPLQLDQRIRDAGYSPSTRIIRVDERTVPAEWIAEGLQIADSERTVFIEQLVLADQEPAALMRSYIPSDLCTDLGETDLSRRSLLKILKEEYGYIPVEAERWLDAGTLSADAAELLSLPAGHPIVVLYSLMRLADSRPVALHQVFWRNERIPFAVDPTVSTSRDRLGDETTPALLADVSPEKQTKRQIREQIWRALRDVAQPDSRYHWDFSEFIPNHEGSDACAEHIRTLDWYRQSRLLFITPDNNLVPLRDAAIRDGIPFIMPTHSLVRGFLHVVPDEIPPEQAAFAATLDGMERFARSLTLDQLTEQGSIDLLVTGASAITPTGIRFGKGHGYFDIEWAVLRELDAVFDETPIIAVVHDCQLIETGPEPAPYDTVVDYIVTPRQAISVQRTHPKPVGILWEHISDELLETIPILQELKTNKKHMSLSE